MVEKDEGKQANYNVIAISNPFWQGFYTFYNDSSKSWSNIYLGDGMKTKQYYIPITV
jgi:hypothetical protein